MASSLIDALRSRAPATPPGSFGAMLSTVKSHTFSDFVVVYRGGDFYNDAYCKNRGTWLGDEGTWYGRQFKVFREMYKARDFRLVLKAGHVGGNSTRELKRAVAVERAKGGLPLELSMPHTPT